MENRIFGVVPSPPDERDFCVTTSAIKLSGKCILPTVKIRNQGDVGSCVAHALASAQDMSGDCVHSTGAIYGNRPAGQTQNAGMIPREAIKSLAAFGNVPLENFPENVEMSEAKMLFENRKNAIAELAQKHKIKAYARVYDPNEFRASLEAGMPIAITVNWYADNTINDDGIIFWGGAGLFGRQGLHEMLVTGYEGDYFQILNSWGKTWNYGWSHASGLFSASTLVEAWALDLGCEKQEQKNEIIRRTLRKGMKGEDVKYLQNRLIALGFDLPKYGADGDFGNETLFAVKSFQKAKYLTVDGIVGRKTWAVVAE